jgi:hypothetical protein
MPWIITAFALAIIALLIFGFILGALVFVSSLIAKSPSLRTNYVGCWALLGWEGFRYLFEGRAGTPGKAAAQGDEEEKRPLVDACPRYVGSGSALPVGGNHSNRNHGAENLPED